MQVCPQCAFENPDGVPICLRCAATLGRTCPACGASLLPTSRFCGQCGRRVEPEASAPAGLTPVSGAGSPAGGAGSPAGRRAAPSNLSNDLRARMPDSLLHKIEQNASGIPGQRREVNILFVDIANSTAASQALDSEELYLAIDEIMHMLSDVVHKYDGSIDKFTGDGLMALFGIPLNHENDPERAVRAALEMQARMHQVAQELKARYNYEFQLRIGLNTGTVVAGYLGNQHYMEYTVIGDTVNLAARLEQAADPGAILVSFSTYQRTRPIFDYKAVPPLMLKGVNYDVPAFQPVGLRVKAGMLRGLPGLEVPMVGRQQDFQALSDAYAQVCQENRGRVVLISGDAGIGKTRLLAEFCKVILGPQVNIFHGACAAYMRITPYHVMADLLRNMLCLSELDTPAIQKEALRQRLELLNLAHNDILPYLLQVLGLLPTEALLEVRLRLLDPTMLQRQTHLALRTLLLAEAHRLPTVLVIDDLHWVDQSSRQFLEYFARLLDQVPILLVLITRDFADQEHPRAIQEAARKTALPPLEIHIHPLSEEAARQLIDGLVVENSSRAKTLKAIIASRSGGNPYYTEELVRILLDRGGLIWQDNALVATSKAGELVKEIPGTLADLVLARFDRLPEALKRTLQKAAVLGQTFAVSLLQIYTGEPLQELADHLADLEARGFLRSLSQGEGDTYRFRHPLLQDVIYHTLLKRELHQFHLLVAQAIEAGMHWLPGERDEILAYHFTESTTPQRAVPYLLASAEKASQNFAYETVAHFYRRALALLESAILSGGASGGPLNTGHIPILPVHKARLGLAWALKFYGEFEEAVRLLQSVIYYYRPPGRVGTGPLQDADTMEVLLNALRELADIRTREGDLNQAVDLLNQGLETLGRHGRETHPSLWRRLADRLAWVYFRQGRLENAHNLADLALLDVADWEPDDPITLASLYNTLGGISWSHTHLTDAVTYVERSLQLYKNLNYQWGMAVALTNLGVLHQTIGRYAEAVDYMEQADHLRSEYGYDPDRVTTLKNLGEVLLMMGDHAQARQKLEICRDISARMHLAISQAYAELSLCRLSIVEEKYPDASLHLQHARQYIDSLDEVNERTAEYLHLEALLEMRVGNLAKAQALAERALQYAEQGEMVYEKAAARLVLGAVHSLAGAFDQAEAHFQDSLALARQIKDPFYEGQAQFELGRMYITQGQFTPDQGAQLYARACSCLDQAIQIFETLGACHDLQRARSLRVLFSEDGAQLVASPRATEVQAQVDSLRSRLGLPEGEWYQATILEVLLTPGQEAGEASTDEEFVFETIAYLLPSLVHFIQANQGSVIRSRHGLTGIFGAPVAHEDDPERAVETAIQIVNFYRDLHQQTELPILLHMGLALGKIVAGRVAAESSGEHLAGEFLAAGDTLLAARILAESCPAARVWATQAVRNATQARFEYVPLSPDLVSRLPDVAIYQLEGLRAQIQPVRGLIGLKTPFIGRNKELDALRLAAQALDASLGGLVWVEGEAGIGKSRLLREFAARLQAEGRLVWWGAGAQRQSDSAFSLFSDLLCDACDVQFNLSPDEIYRRIDQRLERWPQAQADIRPFIQLLVGVAPSGPQGERLAELEPEQLRRQAFVAIHRLVSLQARQQPLVFLLDDVQWMDPTSADLLLYLSHLMMTHPVLFVCAQRRGDPGAFERTRVRIQAMHPGQCLHLPIQSLTIDECHQLLKEFLASANLAGEIQSLIVQQSGGNPYFIEEFVRMLIEQDYLRVVRDRLEINQSLEIRGLPVPSSLESLIRARIDGLAPAARQVLQVAAVIGKQFHHRLLSQVAEQDDLGPWLSLLAERGMLRLADEGGYWEFSHPLIESIVYNMLLRAERKLLHLRTARLLEQQWQGSESEHADELAYHFGKAELYHKALEYLVAAGEQAAARYANDAAIAFFERASDYISVVPEAGDACRFRIFCGLGEVYLLAGNYDASIASLESGLRLLRSDQLTAVMLAGLYRRLGDTAQKKGDPDAALAYLGSALQTLGLPDIGGALDAPAAAPAPALDLEAQAEAARIYARLGWTHFMKANLEAATAAVLKAEAYARQSRSLSALAAAGNVLGGIHYRQGDIKAAMRYTQEAMDHWRELGYTWGVAAGLSNLAILEAAAGNWSASYASLEQATRMRKEMGDIEGMAINYNNLGILLRDIGDLSQAEQYLRDGLAIFRPFQMNWQTANTLMGLGQVLLYQGRLEEAEATLADGLRLAREINARDVLAEMQLARAEVALARGRLDNAHDLAKSAIKLAAEIQSHVIEAMAWRMIARCQMRQGQVLDAQKAISKAWDILGAGSDELETGRLHAQSAAVFRSLNFLERAASHEQAARQIFQRLGARRDLAQLDPPSSGAA